MPQVVATESPAEQKLGRIVVCDVGGTHARFALAEFGPRQATLSGLVTLPACDYEGFHLAWQEFSRRSGGGLPCRAAIAVAGDVRRDVIDLTNSPWTICPAGIRKELGIEQLTIVNDFGAVAQSVPWLGPDDFSRICGPARPLPEDGLVTIVGPGTGLGVASLLRRPEGGYDVIECEGGHMDFAPLDSFEERLLSDLRESFGRVSVERLVSGPGLWIFYQALGKLEDRPLRIRDERELWTAAIEGRDNLAATALDRYCRSLGAIAGDLALAQGAKGVAIAGGIGLRLTGHLALSGFRDRFVAKGRFRRRMEEMPVQLITHPQPGLLGAAAAFLREHPD